MSGLVSCLSLSDSSCLLPPTHPSHQHTHRLLSRSVVCPRVQVNRLEHSIGVGSCKLSFLVRQQWCPLSSPTPVIELRPWVQVNRLEYSSDVGPCKLSVSDRSGNTFPTETWCLPNSLPQGTGQQARIARESCPSWLDRSGVPYTTAHSGWLLSCVSWVQFNR